MNFIKAGIKQVKSGIKKVLKKSPLMPLVQKLRYKRYVSSVKKKLHEQENNKAGILKPKVINLNANDICNSKCTMCNIWQQKQEHEITPDELIQVLRDPLYAEVTHIGITGGEPTLREDLPELYQAVITALPNIQGLSIITNAIKKNDVIERIDKVIEVVKKNNKQFSMMVSLDGYGETHDKIRGREGNFVTAIEVIDYFTAKNIPVSIGSTISKNNLWEAEELLYFLRKKGIYGRFRVAEFINRLYNNDRSEVIRNFTEEESYQLTLFFYKLIYTFEKNDLYKRTYYSIIEVLNGNKRQIGCPYQQDGVVLNSRGELAYCAPKSPIIGNSIDKSGWELYQDNLNIRDEIREKDCDNCIHDYHFPITYKETLKRIEEDFWKDAINLKNKATISIKNNKLEEYSYLKSSSKKALIVGWYGTETVGDKAILAGIVLDLQQKLGPEIEIIVGSLFPYITVHTLIELNIQARVVHAFSEEVIACAKYCDYTIMGGGPLMDLDELSVPLHTFRVAQKAGKETIVYGCGLGPLHFEHNRNAVREILKRSTKILLRDNGSIRLAKEFGFSNVALSGDYAKFYIENVFNSKSGNKRNVVACYLREWTHEYSRDLNAEEFEVAKKQLEAGIVQLIRLKAKEINTNIVELHHMHNFVIGNDDRDFSRYFIDTYFSNPGEDLIVSYDKKLATVESIIENMVTSEHNICMRFHSVLFAETLKTSFTAIDYTKGGKIFNYLKDNNCLDKLKSAQDLMMLV